MLGKDILSLFKVSFSRNDRCQGTEILRFINISSSRSNRSQVQGRNHFISHLIKLSFNRSNRSQDRKINHCNSIFKVSFNWNSRSKSSHRYCGCVCNWYRCDVSACEKNIYRESQGCCDYDCCCFHLVCCLRLMKQRYTGSNGSNSDFRLAVVKTRRTADGSRRKYLSPPSAHKSYHSRIPSFKLPITFIGAINAMVP